MHPGDNSSFHGRLLTFQKVTRAALSDWSTDLGLVLNAFAIFSLVVALFYIQKSELIEKLISFYNSIRTPIFFPVEKIFNIKIPNPVKDFLLFWMISGAIGARVAIKQLRATFKGAEKQFKLLEALPSDDLARVEAKYGGKSGLKNEIDWLKKLQDQSEITRARRIVMWIGCLLTGPLYFAIIWRANAPVPVDWDSRERTMITGRELILAQVVGLVLFLGGLLALNWVTL